MISCILIDSKHQDEKKARKHMWLTQLGLQITAGESKCQVAGRTMTTEPHAQWKQRRVEQMTGAEKGGGCAGPVQMIPFQMVSQ